MGDIPQFLADNKVKIVASLPCYSREGVDSQRGEGTFDKAIIALKHLNELGYGKDDSGLEVDIMFNPAKAGIAPDQQMLEKAYKDKLLSEQGVSFNHLIALSNMPIGRLGKSMSAEDKSMYIHDLSTRFNPETIENLMCRSLISVSPEGEMYDGDFWQMLGLPVNNGSSSLENFDYEQLKNRKIATNPLCFLCTAGAGASCSGSLTINST
jgi:radical SAM/Cys-rich protein